MCLMALAIGMRDDLPFALAANRDEALHRPTAPLHAWTTPVGTPVWAGRDLQDGGTWIGCTQSGRVALLTNVREPAAVLAPAAQSATQPTAQAETPAEQPLRSRGELALRWLDTASHPDTASVPPDVWLTDWVAQLAPQQYGAFNLIVGDVATGRWVWLNNRPATVLPHMTAWVRERCVQPQEGLLAYVLQPGLYGLSNAGLETPWPKTLALKGAVLQATVAGWTDDARERLWATLTNRDIQPDSALPQTGVPLEWERALSAIWVDRPTPEPHLPQGYGTRSSLLMHVHALPEPGWGVTLHERVWRPADVAGDTVIQEKLQL